MGRGQRGVYTNELEIVELEDGGGMVRKEVYHNSNTHSGCQVTSSLMSLVRV